MIEQKHTETHRNDGVFSCNICLQTFAEFSKVSTHLRKSSCKSKDCICDICGKVGVYIVFTYYVSIFHALIRLVKRQISMNHIFKWKYLYFSIMKIHYLMK